MKTIVLTGGGTAGHVNPNIALIPALEREGWKIVYIGSKNGIEKRLLKELSIPYYSIPTGKMRRYRDIKNITDMFKVAGGTIAATMLLGKIKPDIVFSKGGFVGVPVVIGARAKRIPVIIHESDYTPGLANRIALPFANAVCVNFPETMDYIKNENSYLTGNPIRKSLFEGNARRGAQICGFKEEKPVLICIGGSMGSVRINEMLRESLPRLTRTFNIIHICGKGNLSGNHQDMTGYCQFEYVSGDLPHLLALADIAVSRAGANAIAEFIALAIPHILIPLPLSASRGDQILNAKSCERRKISKVLMEEDLTSATLANVTEELYYKRKQYQETMQADTPMKGVEAVMHVIRSTYEKS